MAYYKRRDLIGHFIRKQQRIEQPCTHACCRGYRVHPSNFPVVLPDRTLRRASDDDLTEHFRKVSAGDTDKDRRAEAQILDELERRDREDQRRRDRERARVVSLAARRDTRAALESERDAERERIYRQAEEATRGNWVNKAGQRAGISDREILSGRQAVFQRYASEEARDYFRDHPRPTAAYFRGKDTRTIDRAATHWINRRVGQRRRAA